MATISLFIGNNFFTTTSGAKSGTGGTPAVDDLLLVVTAHTGNTSSAAPTDDNADGLGTYTEITGAACVKNSSADQMRAWVRNALIGSATTTIITHDPGTTTGGGFATYRLTGMTKLGANAIRQAAQEGNVVSGTPTIDFVGVALTENCCFSAVFNGTNPPAQTATAGWTRTGTEQGYSVPATGLTHQKIDSGFTDASVVWGASSATAYCALALELDTSAFESAWARNANALIQQGL